MKTPEDIKMGLEYISTTNIARKVMLAKAGKVPYAYTEEAAADALAYIQQLETRLVEANKTLDDLRAKLVNQATEYSRALKTTTEQRDALKADILRATDKAYEMQSMLDNDVHPNCDYGLYCDLCDALGDVVAWEHKELLDTTPEGNKNDFV